MGALEGQAGGPASIGARYRATRPARGWFDVATHIRQTKKNATLSRGVFPFPCPTAKFGRVI